MTDPTAPIRILIADDHAIVREGIRHVFRQEPGFEVVAEAASGDQAMAMAREHTPDVAVLDITMPGMTGLQVAAALHEEMPGRARGDPQHARQPRVRAGGGAGGGARVPAQGPGRHRAPHRRGRGARRRVVLQPADRGDAHDRRARRAGGGAARPRARRADGPGARRAAGHRQGGDQQGNRGATRHQPPHRGDAPREPDAEAPDPDGGGAHAVCARGGLDVGGA